MKKFKVELHWFKGGYKKTTLWAEDIDEAAERAKMQAPKGYAVTKVREVKATAEELEMMEQTERSRA